MFNKNGVIVMAILAHWDAGYADGLQDPTRPLNTPQESSGSISIVRPSLTVDSILISPSRRIVVINGRSLGEGDFLNEMEVMLIAEDGVGMRRKDGEIYFLKAEASTELVKRRS